jgi:hypothetical protein
MLCVRARRDQNQWDDFAAVRPHMRRGGGIFIFHDVTLARMYRSLHAIQQDAAGPVRVYRSVNHCNEFGTALLASGSEAALPSTFGPALSLPPRSTWNPILAPIYPANINARSSQLSGDLLLDIDEHTRRRRRT